MLAEFKQELERIGSPEATIRGYMSDLNGCIKRSIINESLKYVNIKQFSTVPVSNSTKQRWLYAIKKYARFMAFHGKISVIPKEILYAQLPKREKKIFSVVSRSKIKLDINDPEIKALVHILYSTGARINSISMLKLSDILEDRIVFNNVKNDRPYISILLPQTKKVIEDYLKVRQSSSEYLFVTKNKRATANCLRKRLRRVMGEDYINPHMYRHRLATDLIENGMAISDVADTLNHRSLSITQQYVHVSVSSKEDKLKKVHPMLSGQTDQTDQCQQEY